MTPETEVARKFLETLHRYDLSLLLSVCEASVVEKAAGQFIDDEWFGNVLDEWVVVAAPQPVYDALRALPPEDRKRIAEAVASTSPSNRSFDDITVEPLLGNAEGVVALMAELLIHRDMMIGVATGGERIQDVNDYYIAREARLRERLPSEVQYANPHDDLWGWYHHWSANFGRYAERRHYVRTMFAPAISALSKRSTLPMPKREPTGWERVDRALSKARAQFDVASAEEDFQAIGLLCREVIISTAQAVFDPAIHESLDGVKISATDANRMLDAYVAHVFPGESYKEVRSHYRASLALALNLQHRRTASRQLAALCIEATASTVAVLSIIARPSAP